MAEYIDRGELLKELERFPHLKTAGSVVRSMPKADVATVVRCKDCKYWKQVNSERHACWMLGFEMDYDEYCSYGERKEQK